MLNDLSAKIKNILGINSYSAGDENFVRLIQLAKEDANIRERLLSILSMQGVQRQIALKSIVDSTRISGAPDEFVTAINVLQDEAVADKAFSLLQE